MIAFVGFTTLKFNAMFTYFVGGKLTLSWLLAGKDFY
jgi:hypothetical protein